jgi:hypothetical protein
LYVKAVLRAITNAPEMRERSVVSNSVDEVFLPRIAAEIGERENHDREARRTGPLQCGCLRRGRRPSRTALDRIHPNGPRDILERLVAEVDELFL